MKLKIYLIVFIMFVQVSLNAADESVTPALEANAEVASILKNLGKNQSAMLPNAQIIGEFNETAKKHNLHKTGPRSRDFCKKIVWAPERKRALFCGANHAVPHRLNDVWEFDLAANAWVCLYQPDNERDYLGIGKDYSDVEFKDGILITKRGGPASIAHTWWGLTYDPNEKAMLFMNTWVTKKAKAVEQLGGNPDDLYKGPPLWAFYPESKTWKMIKTEKPFPKPIFGGWLEFVPTLKATIWHTNNWQGRGTWLFKHQAGNLEENTWSILNKEEDQKVFIKNAPMPEQVGYYDSKRNLLVAHSSRKDHKETFHYSFETNTWEKVFSVEVASEEAPIGHDARCVMHFDSKSGLGFLFHFKSNVLWSYDADAKKWAQVQQDGPVAPEGKKRLAYFDPAHGVFVVMSNAQVWVYRP